MFKHTLHKYLNKKRHLKNKRRGNITNNQKDNIPRPIIFGLSLSGLFFVFIPIIFGIWAVVDFEIKHDNKFYPGVHVAGVSVGGQTYDEAFEHFKQKADNLQNNGLDINFEGIKGIREVNIPALSTGLTSDNSIEYFNTNGWENDLNKAYSYGHEGNVFIRFKEQFVLLFTKKDFYFSTIVFKDNINFLFENELYGFLKESVMAEFSLVNNEILISDEIAGEKINNEEIINIIEKKLAQFDNNTLNIKADIDLPKITKDNLIPFMSFSEKFAKETNLIFKYKQRTWKMSGSKLVAWLTVKEDGGIGIDRNKLENYFSSTISKYIVSPPKNSRFKMSDGRLVEIVKGASGNVVDINKVDEQIEKIIFDSQPDLNNKIGTITIPLEVIEVEPKVTQKTVEKYRIRDLVGEVRTSFKGSSNDREHNIKTGVSVITGILIAPGEEFSTVNSIGRVTEKEGYVKEMVIKENKTTKEYGGGLCQVSTTLFRLALNAGLSITERQNHRFVINYYNPPGLDATIYGPHPDLRFVNDTEGYLLLQARVENKEVIMELYGQNDGRSATVSKPNLYNKIPAPPTKYINSADYRIGTTKCFEAPHDGVTTDVLYTVNYADGTTKERNFRSVYKPWQKVCLVGTSYY